LYQHRITVLRVNAISVIHNVFALVNQLNDSESTALLQKGFDGYVSDFADTADVIKTIEETTGILY